MNMLRDLVDAKERQLLGEVDRAVQSNLEAIDLHSQTVVQQRTGFAQAIQQFEANLQRLAPVPFLRYFAAAQPRLVQTAEELPGPAELPLGRLTIDHSQLRACLDTVQELACAQERLS